MDHTPSFSLRPFPYGDRNARLLLARAIEFARPRDATAAQPPVAPDMGSVRPSVLAYVAPLSVPSWVPSRPARPPVEREPTLVASSAARLSPSTSQCASSVVALHCRLLVISGMLRLSPADAPVPKARPFVRLALVRIDQ